MRNATAHDGETGYQFIKRQSQENPNVWVPLSPDAEPSRATSIIIHYHSQDGPLDT